MAGNRKFHNKFHSANHHTLPSPHIKDSALDPVASHDFPFIGDFVLNGVISASNNYLLNSQSRATTLDTIPWGLPVPPGWNVFRDSTYIDGDVTITGNLSALGELTYLHTQVHATSATEIEVRADNTNGKNAALMVDQYGTNDIVHFKNDGISTLLITGSADNTKTLGGWVGINLGNLQDIDRPNQRMTVVGSVSVVPDPLEVADQTAQADPGTSGSLYIEGGLHVNDHTHLDQLTVDTTDGDFVVSGGANDSTANILDVHVPTELDKLTVNTTDGNFTVTGSNKVYIDTKDSQDVGLEVETHSKFNQVTIDTEKGILEIIGAAGIQIGGNTPLDIDSMASFDQVTIDTNDGQFLVESTESVLNGQEKPMNVDVPIELDRVTIDTADGPTLITTSNTFTNHPVDIRVPTILSTLTVDTDTGVMTVSGGERIHIYTSDGSSVGLDVDTHSLFDRMTVDTSDGDLSVIGSNTLNVDTATELDKLTVNTDDGKTLFTGGHVNQNFREQVEFEVPIETKANVLFNTNNTNTIAISGDTGSLLVNVPTTTFFSHAQMNQVSINTTHGDLYVYGTGIAKFSSSEINTVDTILKTGAIETVLTSNEKVEIGGAGVMEVTIPTTYTGDFDVTGQTSFDIDAGPLHIFDSQTQWGNKSDLVIDVPTLTQALTAHTQHGDVKILGSNNLIVDSSSIFNGIVNHKAILTSESLFNSTGNTTLNKTTINTTSGPLEIVGSQEMDVTTDAKFHSNVHIVGDITVDGNAYLSGGSDGVLHMGSHDVDSIVFAADVDSNILPDVPDTHEIGSSTKRWNNIHSKLATTETGNITSANIEDLDVVGSASIKTTENKKLVVHGIGETVYTTPITTHNQLSALSGPWVFGGVDESASDPTEQYVNGEYAYIYPPGAPLPSFQVQSKSLFTGPLTATGPVRIGDLPEGIVDGEPLNTFEVLGNAVFKDGNLKVQSDIRHLTDDSTFIRFNTNEISLNSKDTPLLVVGEKQSQFAGAGVLTPFIEIGGSVGILGENEIIPTLGDGVDIHGSMRVTETLSANNLIVDSLTVQGQSLGVGGGNSSFTSLSGVASANQQSTHTVNGVTTTYIGTDTGIEFDVLETSTGDIQKLYSFTFEAIAADANLGVNIGDTMSLVYHMASKWTPSATTAVVKESESGILHTSTSPFVNIKAQILKATDVPYSERIVRITVQSLVDCNFYVHNVLVQEAPEEIQHVSSSNFKILGDLELQGDMTFNNQVVEFGQSVVFNTVSSDLIPDGLRDIGSTTVPWNGLHVQSISSSDINFPGGSIDQVLTDVQYLSSAIDYNYTQNTYDYSNISHLWSAVTPNSADWNSVVTTVSVNSASWPVQTDITQLTSTVSSNSANWAEQTDITQLTSTVSSNSANWAEQTDITQLTSTVSSNSAAWETQTDVTNLTNSAVDWNSATTTVSSNSAQWGEQTDVTDLTNTVNTNSGTWETTTSTVSTYSAQWETQTDITQLTSTVSSNSAQWETQTDITQLTSTVSSNSAQWETQTDVTNLTNSAVDWNSVVTTVSTNSASWPIQTDITQLTSTVSSNSAQWETQTDVTNLTNSAVDWNDTHSWVSDTSASLVYTSGGSVSGQLNLTAPLSSTGNVTIDGTLSAGSIDAGSIVPRTQANTIGTSSDRWSAVHATSGYFDHAIIANTLHIQHDLSLTGTTTLTGKQVLTEITYVTEPDPITGHEQVWDEDTASWILSATGETITTAITSITAGDPNTVIKGSPTGLIPSGNGYILHPDMHVDGDVAITGAVSADAGYYNKLIAHNLDTRYDELTITEGDLDVKDGNIIQRGGVIKVETDITHVDDENTYIRFAPDQMTLRCHDVNMIRLSEYPTLDDIIILGDQSTAVDLKVTTPADENTIYVDAETGNIGIGTAVPTSKLHIASGQVQLAPGSAGGALMLPSGTTSERFESPGSIRWNTDRGRYEGYYDDINEWASLGSELTTITDDDGDTYMSVDAGTLVDSDRISMFTAGCSAMTIHTNQRVCFAGEIQFDNIPVYDTSGTSTPMLSTEEFMFVYINGKRRGIRLYDIPEGAAPNDDLITIESENLLPIGPAECTSGLKGAIPMQGISAAGGYVRMPRADDSDGDFLADPYDPDDDNDGVPDVADATPTGPGSIPYDPNAVDTDGDELLDSHDPDDDNDGVIDSQDVDPLDPADGVTPDDGDHDGDDLMDQFDPDNILSTPYWENASHDWESVHVNWNEIIDSTIEDDDDPVPDIE